MSIRELANKQFSTTIISSKLSNIAYLLSDMEMNINDIIRERFTSLSKTTSRSASIVFNALSCTYYLKMECNNNLLDNMAVDPIDSSQLSYSNNVKRRSNLVSKAANPNPTRNS